MFTVLCSCAGSQESRVVLIGTTTASQALNGLGFNLDPDQEWQWAAAASAGARHARFQCSWSKVEQQTPPPLNAALTPQYVQEQKCARGLDFARKYGMQATIVAAFGPPYHKILDVTLPREATLGATTLEVQLEKGAAGKTLSNLMFSYDYICPTSVDSSGRSGQECTSQFTHRHSYQGTLITGNSNRSSKEAIISLASAVSQPLPPSAATMTGCSIQANTNILSCSGGNTPVMPLAGSRVVVVGAGNNGGDLITGLAAHSSTDRMSLTGVARRSVTGTTARIETIYIIHEILYPSTASDSPSDPSVVAYSNYVSFLARDMASHGVSGDIEIWNEPPWSNDPWDYRPGLYDSGLYSGTEEYGANYGFAANIMLRHFPPGVTATWNGTSGNASGSLLGTGMKRFTGVALVQPSRVITAESFHPYGGDFGNPENAMFVRHCLEKTASANQSTPAANPFVNGANCYLPGQANNANFMLAPRLELMGKLVDPTYGIGHSITETNELPPSAGMMTQQARSVLRQFIGYEADGITPVEFYKLFDRGPADPSYSFVQKGKDSDSYTPTPAFTSLSLLMASLKAIGNKPLDGDQTSNLPAVASYRGTYPLAMVHMIGAREGAQVNSDALFLWQLSSCTNAKNCWFTLPLAEHGDVALAVPKGMRVTAIMNLVNRDSIPYSTSGQQVSFRVAEDPLEVMVDPERGAKHPE